MADISFKSLSRTDDRNQAITILQGTSSVVSLQPSDDANDPIPTAGYSLAGRFKTDYDATSTVLKFDESDGSIVNDTINNQFLISFSAAITSGVKFKGDALEGVYDFELTAPDGSKTRALYGSFALLREVTV